MTLYRIVLEQVGQTAWTWEVFSKERDPTSRIWKRKGRSGDDGEYGAFASADSAHADAQNFILRQA